MCVCVQACVCSVVVTYMAMSVCVCVCVRVDRECVYSLVVSTWCASLMCETSAMTVEPSAPKGEIQCECVSAHMYLLLRMTVYVTQQCVCVYGVCVCVHVHVCEFLTQSDYLAEPIIYFFVHVGHHEVSKSSPIKLRYLVNSVSVT